MTVINKRYYNRIFEIWQLTFESFFLFIVQFMPLNNLQKNLLLNQLIQNNAFKINKSKLQQKII